MIRYVHQVGILFLISLSVTTQGQRVTSFQIQRGRLVNIRQVDFRNFTYRVSGFSESPTDVKLRNGQYVEKEGGLITYSVKLQKVAFGDLTGDGNEEAALVLIVSGGGSGFVTEGFIYNLRNGQVALLSSFEGGEGGHTDSIETVNIMGGTLDVEHTDSSGNVWRIHYRWNGTRLIETGRTKPRRKP